MLFAVTVVTQATISQLEQTLSDFEQYSTARDHCTSLLAFANEKLRDTDWASSLEADSLQDRMKTLKVCSTSNIYCSFYIALPTSRQRPFHKTSQPVLW